jgi:D-sedoheptulose 7-phosphate isomerase
MDLNELITASISESISVKNEILNNKSLHSTVMSVSLEMISVFKRGGAVLFCGNGGSAADAQHLSAELSGRFKFDRDPLDSDALHCNTSYLTAVANDYSYDLVFSRLAKAKLRQGDILVGLSTSGNSKNILEAFKVANSKGCKTVLLCGRAIGKIEQEASPDFIIKAPSIDTARIQESHIMIGHILCDIVEKQMFRKEND